MLPAWPFLTCLVMFCDVLMGAPLRCFVLLMVCLLVVILKHAHAYPSGAPTCNPKALDNIKSGMGQPPWWLTSDSGGDQTGGFVMRASVDTYEPNSGTVSITLSAPSGGSFSGYLLRASTSDGTPAGAFEAVATSCTSQPCFRRAPYKPGVANPAPCDSTSPDAVITHTNSRLNVFQGQATFTWRPPAQNRGDIKFEAVVVAGSATNWFVLDDVTVEAANVVTSTTTGTDTSPTTTTAQPTPSPVPAPPQDASCEASKLYAGLARWSKLYSATSDDVVVAAGQGGKAGSSMANSKQGDGVNNAMNKYIDALGSLRGD